MNKGARNLSSIKSVRTTVQPHSKEWDRTYLKPYTKINLKLIRLEYKIGNDRIFRRKRKW